jgi:hypothetical protein
MKKKETFSIFALIGLVILFFWKVLFTDSIFIYRDFARYFYPVREFAANSIKSSILPLWNPYLYCGMPFLANLQSAIFYPLSIFPYILPFDFGIKLFVVIHFCLAGIFMYLLMCEWELNPASCLISAIVYTFGGYLLSTVDLLTTLTSATWAPLVLLFYNRAINLGKRKEGEGRSFIYIILTGGALGLQFLGGEPFVLYATLIILTLFTIAKSLSYKLLTGTWLFTPIFFLPIASIIGISLILFQILPFVELLFYSTRRGGVEFLEISPFFSLIPYELLGMFLPLYFHYFIPSLFIEVKQSWLSSLYLGILPIFLIFLAIFSFKRETFFWTTVFILGIFLSLGFYSPIYPSFYICFPFFKMMRFPVKFFYMAAFAGAILSGFGFNYLQHNINHKFIKYLLIITLLFDSTYLFLYLNKASVFNFIHKNYFSSLPFEFVSNHLQQYFNPINIVIFLSLALLFIQLAKLNKISLKILSLLLIIITTIDLFIVGSKINPLGNNLLYKDKYLDIQIIKEDNKGYHRIMLESNTQNYFYKMKLAPISTLIFLRHLLVPNTGLKERIFDVGGYESLELKDYITLLNTVKEAEFTKIHHLLNLLNVKYLISKFNIASKDLKLLYNKGVKIYENISYLPRAFFFSSPFIIKDREEILKLLLNRKNLINYGTD